MIVLGVDPSLTATGVAVWCEEVIVMKRSLVYPPIKSHGVDGRFTRYLQYAAELEDLISEFAVTHVFIEGYGYANRHTLVPLVELGALLRETLYESDAAWYEVAPTQLKKFICGKGTAKKDLMLLELFKRSGIECETSDEADAVALAFLGAAALGNSVPFPKASVSLAQSVIDKAN